jgi:hypothetical protein
VKTFAALSNGILADKALSGIFVSVLVEPDIDLFVKVSVVALPKIVSVVVGKVRVLPEFVRVGLLMTGEVSVLFVRVSVVALPTNVSVLVGNVRVPVLTMDDMVGVVIVGLVNVLLVRV